MNNEISSVHFLFYSIKIVFHIFVKPKSMHHMLPFCNSLIEKSKSGASRNNVREVFENQLKRYYTLIYSSL